MCEAMKDPRADQFSADVFAEYRRKRLEAGVTASNMNREHAYLRACFNELTRLNHWKRDNPMKHIRAIKVQELALTYLTAEQIPKLLNELTKSRNPHAYIIAKTCLCTGARWGEVEDLRVSQIRNQQITFARTKTGPARSVPIAPELEDQLHNHHTTHGIEDRLFAAASGAFREGVERMGLTLPDGQMTHVLRHTFASHFMMNGGNILALQKILGHKTLAMTMRYSHLAPDHLAEARQLNPVARLNLTGQVPPSTGATFTRESAQAGDGVELPLNL
jgi:integrase